MTKSETIIMLVTLLIGFGAGFVLRPVIVTVKTDGVRPLPGRSVGRGARNTVFRGASG